MFTMVRSAHVVRTHKRSPGTKTAPPPISLLDQRERERERERERFIRLSMVLLACLVASTERVLLPAKSMFCCQHRTPATAPSPEDEQRAVSTPTALSNTVPTALCNTVTVCHLRTKACKRLPPCELPPCEQVPIVSKEGENDRRTNSTQ